MNDIQELFSYLPPTTLAAITADLDDADAMTPIWYEAMTAGMASAGEDFWPMLDAARAERDGNGQRAEDLSGNNGPVAAILARQNR